MNKGLSLIKRVLALLFVATFLISCGGGSSDDGTKNSSKSSSELTETPPMPPK